MDRTAPLIVITGPTGSGKTAIALKLARNYPLEIISADSMQVYRHMDIATAKPSRDELFLLPHHLIDVADPGEEFNAGMFVSLAGRKISEISSRNAVPVVAGGTGLYIKALIYGLADAPPRSNRMRAILRSIAEEKGSPYLWRFFHRLDPEAARKVGPNDRVRIVRALEIIFLTGRKPSRFHQDHGFVQARYDARIVCILPDRKKLYETINARVIRMIDSGLIEETRRLLALGFGPELRSMQTLAYKHVIEHLESKVDLDTAISRIQRDTRRYAKRQITWMKSHYSPESFHSPEEVLPILDGLLRDAIRAGV